MREYPAISTRLVRASASQRSLRLSAVDGRRDAHGSPSGGGSGDSMWFATPVVTGSFPRCAPRDARNGRRLLVEDGTSSVIACRPQHSELCGTLDSVRHQPEAPQERTSLNAPRCASLGARTFADPVSGPRRSAINRTMEKDGRSASTATRCCRRSSPAVSRNVDGEELDH